MLLDLRSLVETPDTPDLVGSISQSFPVTESASTGSITPIESPASGNGGGGRGPLPDWWLEPQPAPRHGIRGAAVATFGIGTSHLEGRYRPGIIGGVAMSAFAIGEIDLLGRYKSKGLRGKAGADSKTNESTLRGTYDRTFRNQLEDEDELLVSLL